MKIINKILLLSLALTLVSPMVLAQYSANTGATVNIQGEASTSTRTETKTETSGQATTNTGATTDTKTNATTDSKGTSTGASAETRKTFVLPHILEASGVRVATGDVNGDGLVGIIMTADVDGDGIQDALTVDKELDKMVPTKSLVVAGAEVRGWDATTKAAVRARLQANDAKNDANDLGLRVALQAIDHADVDEIVVRENDQKPESPAVSVKYMTRLRLLLVFPVNVAAVASVNNGGQISNTFDASWLMRLLSVKGDQSAYVKIATDVKVARDSASGMATGK